MTRQVVSSPWPVWGTAGSRVLLAAGWGGRGLDHRCLWQSDPPCGCTPVGEKSTLRLVLFWEFLIKLNNLIWQTNAAYAIKKTPKTYWPWGHLEGRTARSSPPRGCPALELPRLCTAGCRSQRCRTGRRWWYVWSAFVCPAKWYKAKERSEQLQLQVNICSPSPFKYQRIK